MKVLVIVAHPEPRSFIHSLVRAAIAELESNGHTVQISDLYAMKWKAVTDRSDYPHLDADTPASASGEEPTTGARLHVGRASGEAFKSQILTPDVAAEQAKLLWSDFVLLAFPLWWYSMPAIMKGWFDRVYTKYFAYGIGEQTLERWGERYGDGGLAGRRAMVLTTVGGWEEHYGPRGITGPMDDKLYHITHGMLNYAGMEVLPSLVVYLADRADDDTFARAEEAVRGRMRSLEETRPMGFRKQNDGDYELPSLALKNDLEDEGATGFGLHRRKADEDRDVIVSVSGPKPEIR